MKVCTYCQEKKLEYKQYLENFLEEELVPHPEDIYVTDETQRWCSGLICKECKVGVALKVVDEQWLKVEDILKDNDPNQHGWVLSRGSHDRWLQGVLNNIVYYINEPPDEKENETDYSLPSTDDQVRIWTYKFYIIWSFKIWLCWNQGQAVGFCTLKNSGNKVPGTLMDKYQMDIVDSVFVRLYTLFITLNTKICLFKKVS